MIPERRVIRQWRLLGLACALAFAAAAGPAATWVAEPAASGRAECVILQPIDGPAPYVSDPAECARPTSPASTFKIPHALIALETGVVSSSDAVAAWDGTRQAFPAWERDHSLDSAMTSSVVWFFRRTAASIGSERMRRFLSRLAYADDSFEGDVTLFWLNGDLVVSPGEQVRFLARLVRHDLPVQRGHADAVLASLTAPEGSITSAAGTHDFGLHWSEPLVVQAKTGNTTVAGERVSWLVGHIRAQDRQYVFASRVRAGGPLAPTAGADLARRVLNAHRPEVVRRPRSGEQ